MQLGGINYVINRNVLMKEHFSGTISANRIDSAVFEEWVSHKNGRNGFMPKVLTYSPFPAKMNDETPKVYEPYEKMGFTKWNELLNEYKGKIQHEYGQIGMIGSYKQDGQYHFMFDVFSNHAECHKYYTEILESYVFMGEMEPDSRSMTEKEKLALNIFSFINRPIQPLPSVSIGKEFRIRRGTDLCHIFTSKTDVVNINGFSSSGKSMEESSDAAARLLKTYFGK